MRFEEPVNRVKLEELPQRYAALNFLFPGNSAVDDRRGNYYENIPPSGAVQLFCLNFREKLKKTGSFILKSYSRDLLNRQRVN